MGIEILALLGLLGIGGGLAGVAAIERRDRERYLAEQEAEDARRIAAHKRRPGSPLPPRRPTEFI